MLNLYIYKSLFIFETLIKYNNIQEIYYIAPEHVIITNIHTLYIHNLYIHTLYIVHSIHNTR